MSQDQDNNTISRQIVTVQLFSEQQYATGQERTVICIGAVRGGTSAVAGTLTGMGIMMGEDLPDTYEDPDFLYQSKEYMISAIKKRNEKYSMWGWKCPDAANYLDSLKNDIRNPILVIVCRDVVATLNGHLRWHSKEKTSAISKILLQQQKNIELALRWTVPTLLVSYEKLINHPGRGVAEIAGFLDVDEPGNMDSFLQFLEPEKYKFFLAGNSV